MVEESLAGSQEHIIHMRLDGLGERAVTLDTQFQVGTIVAHHIDHGLGQLISVLLIHPSLHCLHDFGIDKAVDMVPSSPIATVGTEVALVAQALEGHAEVITLGVERIARMFDYPSVPAAVSLGDEDVETAHAGMPV